MGKHAVCDLRVHGALVRPPLVLSRLPTTHSAPHVALRTAEPRADNVIFGTGHGNRE